jgi:hypothetical protein
MKNGHLRYLYFIAGVLVSLLGGCRDSKFDIEFQENFWVSQMGQAFSTAQASRRYSLWLTNRLEITSMMPLEYLAAYEKKFLTYGYAAGFTNSLLEKYLLLPPGVTGRPPDSAEIMLVSALLFKKKSGQTGRMTVEKYKEHFGAGWIDEEMFQATLSRSGIQLSSLASQGRLPSMRHLNDPDGKKAAMQKMLSKEGTKAMEEYEREHPIPLTQRRYFPHACMGALTIAIALLIWWFYRGGSKSSR